MEMFMGKVRRIISLDLAKNTDGLKVFHNVHKYDSVAVITLMPMTIIKATYSGSAISTKTRI